MMTIQTDFAIHCHPSSLTSTASWSHSRSCSSQNGGRFALNAAQTPPMASSWSLSFCVSVMGKGPNASSMVSRFKRISGSSKTLSPPGREMFSAMLAAGSGLTLNFVSRAAKSYSTIGTSLAPPSSPGVKSGCLVLKWLLSPASV